MMSAKKRRRPDVSGWAVRQGPQSVARRDRPRGEPRWGGLGKREARPRGHTPGPSAQTEQVPDV